MFTEQQILEIQRKLASKGFKDTDFNILNVEDIDGEEWVTVVANGQNKRVRMKDIWDGFEMEYIEDLEEIRRGAALGATAYQKPEGGIPIGDMTPSVQSSLGKADTAYQKPNSGVPKSDLEDGVQTSLGKADTAYQKPTSGIPSTDMSEEVQTSLDKADSAYLRPDTGIPYEDMSSDVKSSLDKADSAIQDLTPITELIPNQATAQNQLADKEFVNSSISTATAEFKGTYNLVTDLSLTLEATQAQIGAAIASVVTGEDNNDYTFVMIPTADETPTEISRVDRYKYNGTSWIFEYSLNNSSFTAAQWAALNSNITAQKVLQHDAKYDKPSSGIPKNDLANAVQTSLNKADTAYQKPSGGIPKTDMASAVQTSLGKADSALQPNALNDYYNKTQIDSRYDGDATLTDEATFIYRPVADGKLTSMARNYVFTVVNNPSGNPSTSGWYEKTNNDKYTPTADTTVTANKIYYARSVDGACPAQIKSVRGKSLVWNQLAQVPANSAAIQNNSGATIAYDKDTKICTINGSGTISVSFVASKVHSMYNIWIAGHKYIIILRLKKNDDNIGLFIGRSVEQSAILNVLTGSFGIAKTIVTASSASPAYPTLSMNNMDTGLEVYLDNNYVSFIDLTLMFGAGNEPTTVEEFEAMFPLPYYAYNAGALISNKTEQVESVGFNQWDEEWEEGKINAATGTNAADSNRIRSKNYIPVIEGTYYFHVGAGFTFMVVGYDSEKRYVKVIKYPNATNGWSFDVDSGIKYIRFASNVDGYGNTYRNDICVNLSDPSRNGEYEPYKKNTVTLNLPTLTGKLNGEGESVVVFPDGLKSAGSVYDEIVGNKAIKRVGVVDLGTLTWVYNAASMGDFTSASMVDPLNKSARNITCAKYDTSRTSTTISANQEGDKWITVNAGASTTGAVATGTLIARDIAYSDANTFKTAMSGVMLNYTLATPEEYILDEPISDTFQVDINGTERRLPEDTSTSVTAPFCADILYEPDRSAYHELERKIDTKQDIISDLPEIRSGAQAGAALSGGIVNKITDEFLERPAANGQLFGLNSDYLFERVNNPTGDPSQQGWYESINNGKFVLTEDETAVEGKIYYNKSILKSNGAAQMNEVAGRSQVWNQLVQNGDFSEGTRRWSTSGTSVISVADNVLTWSNESTSVSHNLNCQVAFVNGHKYYLVFNIKGDTENKISGGLGQSGGGGIFSTIDYSTSWKRIANILAPSTVTSFNLYLRPNANSLENPTAYFRNIILLDLTLLGIDNLTTVEEVEAWLAKNIGLKPYYPYNAGTVLNANMKSIESLGFNLLDPTTGKARIIGAYSDVYGNYYGITGTHGTLTFTSDLGEVSEITPDSDGKFLISTPGWLDVASAGADCAVFLWWDGSKTDYVDYQKNVARLDITHIYGKKNGTGSLVQVWPTGMSGIRNIKDSLEIVDGAVVAKVNIWKYVLTGSETWTKWGDANAYYNTNGLSKRARSYPCIASKLPYASVADIYSERKAGVVTNGSNIYVDGGNYANISNFTGMEIYYALETTELYTDLVYQGSDLFSDGTPVTLPVNYQVNESGVERILPQNTSEGVVTVFPTISSTYVLDTAYKVSRIDKTHVSKGSIEDLLTKLEEADIIDSGWSVTYDTTTGKLIYNGIAKPE